MKTDLNIRKIFVGDKETVWGLGWGGLQTPTIFSLPWTHAD